MYDPYKIARHFAKPGPTNTQYAFNEYGQVATVRRRRTLPEPIRSIQAHRARRVLASPSQISYRVAVTAIRTNLRAEGA